MALWKERSQPLHLLVRQPEQIAHDHPRSSGALNHAAAAASSKSMGPDPKSVNFLADTRLDVSIKVVSHLRPRPVPGRFLSIGHSGNPAQPIASSSALDTPRTSASAPGRPVICAATGKPEAVRDTGNTAEGCPARLAGVAKGAKR